MADTGFNWAAWEFAQLGTSSGDWVVNALATATEETGEAIDLDITAACEVGVSLLEPSDLAITGDVTIYVLREMDGVWEESLTGSPYGFAVTPVQNDTVTKVFSVDPGMIGTFKISIDNNSGQSLDVTVKFRTATIPVAS